MADIIDIETRVLFEIRIGDDGYYAIRETEPLFCLRGSSIQDVAAKADRAFESYREFQNPK